MESITEAQGSQLVGASIEWKAVTAEALALRRNQKRRWKFHHENREEHEV